jgi:hypothetical protein
MAHHDLFHSLREEAVRQMFEWGYSVADFSEHFGFSQHCLHK